MNLEVSMNDRSSFFKAWAATGAALACCLALPAHGQHVAPERLAADSEAAVKGQFSPASDLPNPHDFSGGGSVHKYPWRHPDELKALADQAQTQAAAKTSPNTLVYYGGPVISNVSVVKVNYGTGTYPAYVSGTGAGTLSAFYKGILGSPYFTWLNGDYKTPTQTIGYGSFVGDYAVTPAAAHNGATIDDTAIQAELVAQINAKKLPAPTANTYYALHFPKGKKITQGGTSSCASGGFCAYHGTIPSASTPGGYIYYAVLPDNSTGSGCATGCGGSTAYNNWCSVSSHELIEAVTDAAVGVATTISAPLAWYNSAKGEIGDICNAQQGTVVGTDKVTYTVQKEWSNSAGSCRAQ